MFYCKGWFHNLKLVEGSAHLSLVEICHGTLTELAQAVLMNLFCACLLLEKIHVLSLSCDMPGYGHNEKVKNMSPSLLADKNG